MIIDVLDNEIVIRLALDDNKEDFSELIRYLKYLDISSKSKATKKEIEEFITSVKKGRWERFIQNREINA